MESAEVDEIPEVEPVAEADIPPAEPDARQAEPAPDAEPHSVAEPERSREPDPASAYDLDSGRFDDRLEERVTTPPAPTTLEDGLEETIIRPRVRFEGGDRG